MADSLRRGRSLPMRSGGCVSPLVSGQHFPTARFALRTLLEWRSGEVTRPEPPADGNAAWLGSRTTSPTSSGPRSELLGVAARTAARRTSRCSATAYSHSPVVGGTPSTTSCRPARPVTPASATTKSPVGSGKRLDERAFLLRHIEERIALGLHQPAPDAAPAPPETTQEALGPTPMRPEPVEGPSTGSGHIVRYSTARVTLV
jgi:hypothetical protein